MKLLVTIIALAATLALAAVAPAVSITVDTTDYWLAPGTTFVDISGTVDNTDGIYPITFAGAVEHSSNLSWDGHWHIGDPAFFNGHTPLMPGESYTGPLFEIGNMTHWNDDPVYVTMTPIAFYDTGSNILSFNGDEMFTIHTSGLHAVPEPAGVIPMAVGLVGILARRRRTRVM